MKHKLLIIILTIFLLINALSCSSIENAENKLLFDSFLENNNQYLNIDYSLFSIPDKEASNYFIASYNYIKGKNKTGYYLNESIDSGAKNYMNIVEQYKSEKNYLSFDDVKFAENVIASSQKYKMSELEYLKTVLKYIYSYNIGFEYYCKNEYTGDLYEKVLAYQDKISQTVVDEDNIHEEEDILKYYNELEQTLKKLYDLYNNKIIVNKE